MLTIPELFLTHFPAFRARCDETLGVTEIGVVGSDILNKQ
jgi:hypothetical protein